ncbi:MAG: DNA replication and repair protein RecF [Trueperaceae bacterium]
MRLLSLSQLNVRNLRTPRLEFTAGINAIVGRNAAGKSNLLEAAYLACTGEMAGAKTVELVRLGEEQGYVAAEVEHDEGVSEIEVGLAPGRKQIRIDKQAARASDVARVVTAVLLTPEDAELVHGPPSGRRGYLDGLLARLSPRYGALTREYHRVVEQRNALLRMAPFDPSLAVWSERFLALGTEIEELRARALVRLAPLASEVYAEIGGPAAPLLGVSLQRSHHFETLAEALAAATEEEQARRLTVVGPHRDDLGLTLGGHSVQAYGSRGEARTAALALRVAEYRLLAEKHREPPVLLMDDFTAELDESRRAYLLRLAASTPQALVTGTEPPPRYDRLLNVEAGLFTEGALAHG